MSISSSRCSRYRLIMPPRPTRPVSKSRPSCGANTPEPGWGRQRRPSTQRCLSPDACSVRWAAGFLAYTSTPRPGAG